MGDKTIMPFGAHKGKAMEDVPAGYLLFCYAQTWIGKYPDVREYIKDNLDVLEKQAKE